MSREAGPALARPLAVWLAASVASVAALALARRPAAAVAGPWSPEVPFADALVRVCALALVLAVARLWVVTTLTVGQVLSGHAVAPGGGATRRLVLLACGAALAAGAGAPAAAADGDHDVLSGLRLPDRAVSPAPHAPAGAVHVVAPGDSLWSIAAAASPAGSDVDAAWRAIWAANRDVVGDDPHLIVPGQRLRLPGADVLHQTPHQTPHHSTDETGDRP